MRPSEIKAEAEEDTEFLTIPVDYLDDWMTRYKSWKSFMLETYRDRFNDLIRTIDSIAFLKLDERLEKYLNEKVRVLKSRNIEITHQQIAEELNSSREVISRLLKKLEQQNRVKLGRNKLEWLG
jgi:CRP/FNR family transcriptional regulator